MYGGKYKAILNETQNLKYQIGAPVPKKLTEEVRYLLDKAARDSRISTLDATTFATNRNICKYFNNLSPPRK